MTMTQCSALYLSLLAGPLLLWLCPPLLPRVECLLRERRKEGEKGGLGKTMDQLGIIICILTNIIVHCFTLFYKAWM